MQRFLESDLKIISRTLLTKWDIYNYVELLFVMQAPFSFSHSTIWQKQQKLKLERPIQCIHSTYILASSANLGIVIT